MIRIVSYAQRSQMYTRGPATSLSTSASERPQNEQRRFLENIIHQLTNSPTHQLTNFYSHNVLLTRAAPAAATPSGSGVKSSPGLMNRSFSNRYCLS